MYIDKIEPLDKRRSRVYLDGAFAFALYNGEIRRYRLEEGCEIEEPLYEEILRETVCRRARERALYLLRDMDRTEHELRAKLKISGYPDPAIEEELYEEIRPDTAEQIQRLLRKKGYAGQEVSREEKGKLAAYLMRRGFSWEEARNAL